MPQIAALDPLVGALSRYLGAALSTRVGAQHALDHEYFNRISALDYAMAHDDGQGTAEQLEGADVVLCGVSRTSKTPTCIYLAHRGIRAANVPLVPGQEDGERLVGLKNPLVIGLTVSPDRLVQIRRNRLDGLNADHASAYVDHDLVREETVKARRAFERRGWPTIDVTRRSVEETAAAIVNLLSERRTRRIGASLVMSGERLILASQRRAPRHADRRRGELRAGGRRRRRGCDQGGHERSPAGRGWRSSWPAPRRWPCRAAIRTCGFWAPTRPWPSTAVWSPRPVAG
jgi:hypothetical protein